MPLLTRALNVDEYGAADVIATFVAFTAIGMKIGLPNALVRYYKDYEVAGERRQLASTLLVFVTTLGLVAVMAISFTSECLASVLGLEEYSRYLGLGAWIALLVTMTSIPRSVLRMERKIVVYNLANLVYTLSYVGLAWYFVLGQNGGLISLFRVQLAANVVSFVFAFGFSCRHLALGLTGQAMVRALKYSLPLVPNLIAVWIYQQVDRLVLLQFVGVEAVGVFGAAARIGQVVVLLLAIFQNAWVPYSMGIIKDPRRNEIYRRMLTYYAGGFAMLGLLLTAISPEVFALLLPSEYRHGYSLVPWIVGSAILHYSSTLTRLGLMVRERTGPISFLSWIAVVINVAMTAILVGKLGISGAAVGSFVSQLVFTSLLAWVSARESDVRFDVAALTSVGLTYVIGSTALIAMSRISAASVSIAVRLAASLVALAVIASTTIDHRAELAVRHLSRRLVRVFGHSSVER